MSKSRVIKWLWWKTGSAFAGIPPQKEPKDIPVGSIKVGRTKVYLFGFNT